MDERIPCLIDGCDKPSRNLKSPGLCKMHYHRQYRHGDVNRTAPASDVTASLGRRYRTLYRTGHPLASKHGRVYEHRFVLYEAIGPGPHQCHWCGCRVEWVGRGEPHELQPDHLNDDGADNRLENLVPACRRCNSTRALQRRHDALVAAGWWAAHDTVGKLGSGRKARVQDRSSGALV